MNHKKTGIIDASSAILIYKSGLFPEVLNTWEICCSASVFREVTASKRPGDAFFRRLVKNGDIVITDVPDHKCDDVLLRMGEGERDTIMLYLSGAGDFIIIDDGKGARFCRDREIPYCNALLVPRILFFAGKRTESESAVACNDIAEIGRYTDEIVAYAHTCTYKQIKKFLVT